MEELRNTSNCSSINTTSYWFALCWKMWSCDACV